MSNENRSVINSNLPYSESIDKISILFKSKDPTKGIVLQQDRIKQIEITESMFSLLPTISITFTDTGRFFYEYHVKSGDSLFVTITGNIEEDEKNAKPILDSKFIIQSVQMIPQPESEVTDFLISGIFAAESYLNEIIVYPESNSLLNGQYKKKKSSEVVKDVCNDIGLYVDTNDSLYNDFSYWICCNETRAQFINRIASHAWVEEDDAPIIFADKQGILKYTSIKTLAKQERTSTIKDFKTSMLKDAAETKQYLLTEGFNIINASGPILNQGGYVVKQSTYDPYNTVHNARKIFTDDKQKDLEEYANNSILNILNLRNDSKDPKLSFKQSQFSHDESYLKGITSKDTANLEICTTSTYGGTKFDELHDHYEIAPTHNEMIRRSFFQNFIKISIDTSRQNKLFSSGKKRPALGEKCFVDFSGNRINKIYSGDYIINMIRHLYVPGSSYTQMIYLSSDCYYGENK